uniref:Uncharacterized protein n=1 Tax=Aegilops tauschii subsp. strangulata TaxID=200361 RepID=A0A453KQB3_AEGTS
EQARSNQARARGGPGPRGITISALTWIRLVMGPHPTAQTLFLFFYLPPSSLPPSRSRRFPPSSHPLHTRTYALPWPPPPLLPAPPPRAFYGLCERTCARVDRARAEAYVLVCR